MRAGQDLLICPSAHSACFNSPLSWPSAEDYADLAIRPSRQKNTLSWRNAMPSPTPVNRRTLLTILGGSIAMPPLAPRNALAPKPWPGRTVRHVNRFPAGGATDTLSRILCQKMSELSGQSFVVENRAGAGGVLGADAVAKSQPDGYTVGLGGIAQNVLAIGSYAKLPFDPRGDFTFIS